MGSLHLTEMKINTVYIDIDSVYAGQWKRNDVYVQFGLPDVNWQTSDGEAAGYYGVATVQTLIGQVVFIMKQISNNISISALVDIALGHIVNYTKKT